MLWLNYLAPFLTGVGAVHLSKIALNLATADYFSASMKEQTGEQKCRKQASQTGAIK